jgi:hypothetical protein
MPVSEICLTLGHEMHIDASSISMFEELYGQAAQKADKRDKRLSDCQEQNQIHYVKLTIEEWVKMAERKRNARCIDSSQKPLFSWAVPAGTVKFVKPEETADA